MEGTNRMPINFRADLILYFLLAICPILQHYKGIFSNPSMEIYVVLSVVMIYRLIQKNRIFLKPIIPLFIYGVYASFIHGFSVMNFLREMLQIVIYLAILNECIQVKDLMKVCTFIAKFATCILMVQYVSYYVLGRHLQLVPTGLLLDRAEQWIMLAKTGIIDVNGNVMSFYRPSAIFLEPSHFAIYCIPVLFYNLFSDRDKHIGGSVFISLGVLMSTSGIGLVALVAIWSLYVVFIKFNIFGEIEFKIKNMFRSKSLLFICGGIAAFCVLFFAVGSFRQSVLRIFVSSAGEKTAIQGRTSTGIRALALLKGKQNLIGVGDSISVVDWNMSGFFLTFFVYGLIGVILFYAFYVIGLKKLKGISFWMSIIIIGLSIFTVHMYAAYYKMYYTFIVIAGYIDNRKILETKVKGLLRIK